MLRRKLSAILIGSFLVGLLAGCGGGGGEAAVEEEPRKPSWMGDWTRAFPVSGSVPINFTFRVRESGHARLVAQNGPARPFLDLRGQWGEDEEGRYATLRQEDGSEVTYRFRVSHPTLTLDYPFREHEKIVFTR